MDRNVLQTAYEEWLRMQMMQRAAAGRYMFEQSPFTNMRMQFRGGSDEFAHNLGPRFGGQLSAPLAGGEMSLSGNYQSVPGRPIGPDWGAMLRYRREY